MQKRIANQEHGLTPKQVFGTVAGAIQRLQDEGVMVEDWQIVINNPKFRKNLAWFMRTKGSQEVTKEDVARTILTNRSNEVMVFGPREWMHYYGVEFSKDDLNQFSHIPFPVKLLRDNSRDHFLCLMLDSVNGIPWTVQFAMEKAADWEMPRIELVEPLIGEDAIRHDTPRFGWHFIRKGPILVNRYRTWKERKASISDGEEMLSLVEHLQMVFLYYQLKGKQKEKYALSKLYHSTEEMVVKLSRAKETFYILGAGQCIPTVAISHDSAGLIITVGAMKADHYSLDKLDPTKLYIYLATQFKETY